MGKDQEEYAAGTVTVYRRRKRSYLFCRAFAAVFVLVLGSGLTSVGSKSYWKELWNNFVGDEKVSGIDVEDMEKQETEDLDELGIYKEITEKLGISVVRLQYKPKGMVLSNYNLDIRAKKERNCFIIIITK